MACTIICPVHGPLVDLKRHCHNIYKVFIFMNLYDEPASISQWFQIASGITQVKYISDLYDNESQWCGPSLDYEEARSSFHSRLILELSRFNFIWSGFEACVDELELPRCPKYSGKINAVNSYLKEHYLKEFQILSHYQNLINLLKEKISLNPWYAPVNEIFLANECVSDELIGLKVVYKIRNLLAHGAFSFSEPDDYNSVKPHDVSIIALCSRIILISLQMLIIVREQDLNFYVDRLGRHPDEDSPHVREYLEKLHLKSYSYS